MSAPCSDFIVKRKRRRPSAIDPCPGFYTDPTTPVIKVEQDLVPPICVLTPPPPSSPVPTVTSVDAFLRQSCSKPPRKVYTRFQKRPRHDSSNDNFVPSPDDDDGDEEETTKQPNPPRLKRRAPARVLSHPNLKKPGIGERMMEAIVSTHVQPSDGFMMSMIGDGSGRQPLRFIPGDDPPSRIFKRGSLVDPKRIVMHRSSFPSGAVDCTTAKKGKERRPMSTWRPEPTGHLAGKGGANTVVCPPLEFIDFREAEALYATQKKARRDKQRDISQEKRKVRRNASTVPNPLVFVPSISATPIVSNPFPSVSASYCPLPSITTTTSMLTPTRQPSSDNLPTSPIDQSSDLFSEESFPISSMPAFDEVNPKSDPIADQQPMLRQDNSQALPRTSYEYRARILCADTPRQPTRTIAVDNQSQFLQPAIPVYRIPAPREDSSYQPLSPEPAHALLQTSLPPAQEPMPHILHKDSSRQMPAPAPLQASRPPAQESIPRHTTPTTKLLKPLASFLDDFSKIARSAAIHGTQTRPRTGVSRPPRTRHRRPMTANATALERSYPSFSASDAFEIDGDLEGDEDLEGKYVAKGSRYSNVISVLGDRQEEWVLF